MKNNFFIGIIAILMLVVLLQRSSCTPKTTPALPHIDTIVREITVHDTLVGRTVFLKAKKDTIWKDSIQYRPDTSYAGLLKQYDSAITRYFTEHIFKTDYKLGTYGTASVYDTVVANMITGNSIAYNVTIPEKIVTIIKPYVPVRQFYLGGGLYGNSLSPVKSAHVGLLYKDRQDKIFIGSVGFDGQIVYGFQSYWKIRLK
jgi:hypothetical protein